MQQLQILQGHVLDRLRELPDESVFLVVTSPAYWGLRNYGAATETVWGGSNECAHEWGEEQPPIHQGQVNQTKFANKPSSDQGGNSTTGRYCIKCSAWKGQLGLEPRFELYVQHIVEIFHEVKRVLKPTGSLYINLGDTYSGSGGAGGDYNEGGFREGQPTYRQGKSGLPPKCMIGIPERIMLAMIADGWILRSKPIWAKPNNMPSSAPDRYTNSYEPMYFFGKSSDPQYWTNSRTGGITDKQPKGTQGVEGQDWEWIASEEGDRVKGTLWESHSYYFDLDAIRVPHRTKHVVSSMTGSKYANSTEKHLLRNNFRHEGGKNPGDVWTSSLEDLTKEQLLDLVQFDLSKKQLIEIIQSIQDGTPSDVWAVNTKPYKEAHFATFPERLVQRPILASCPEWVCVKCGKPRERIVQSQNHTRTRLVHVGQDTEEGMKGRAGSTSAVKTVGWTDCGCGAGFVGGVVLDPFMGSGTTGKVTLENNRRFIGIEVNPEYIEMAKRRMDPIAGNARLM